MKRACGVLAVSLLASVPSGADPRRIEGEHATPDNSFCGDRTLAEPMQPSSGEPGASGDAYLVFPGDGCSATFGEAFDAGTVLALRFTVSGASGELCGWFELSGGIVGATRLACTVPTAGQWTVLAADATPRTGPFTLTWRVDGTTTPTWVNAYLDFVEVG